LETFHVAVGSAVFVASPFALSNKTGVPPSVRSVELPEIAAIVAVHGEGDPLFGSVNGQGDTIPGEPGANEIPTSIPNVIAPCCETLRRESPPLSFTCPWWLHCKIPPATSTCAMMPFRQLMLTFPWPTVRVT
jgi:hypothetical protein